MKRIWADGTVRTASVPAAKVGEIFSDGFESGDARAWDRAIGATCGSGTVVGADQLTFADRVATWSITNYGSSGIVLESLSITWPATNKKLQAVRIADQPIFSQVREPPFTTIDGGFKIGAGFNF